MHISRLGRDEDVGFQGKGRDNFAKYIHNDTIVGYCKVVVVKGRTDTSTPPTEDNSKTDKRKSEGYLSGRYSIFSAAAADAPATYNMKHAQSSSTVKPSVGEISKGANSRRTLVGVSGTLAEEVLISLTYLTFL